MSPTLRARLAVAPEMLVIALADRALEALVIALAVEHPTLADLDQPTRVPTLRRARRVARFAACLRRELAAYRVAVDAAAHPEPPADDFPF